MPPLPFALIRHENTVSIVLLGIEDMASRATELLGFDPVRLEVLAFEPEDIDAVVSVEPAAVYHGVGIEWQAAFLQEGLRMVAANRRPRYAPKGGRFGLLPEGTVSGYPIAETHLRRHRMMLPSEDAIRVSALFAVSTVRVPIAKAEEQFDCFGELYRARGRQMPDLARLKRCFVGLQNTKSAVFTAVAKYAPTIRDMMGSGLRDRELRRVLALERTPPEGLGLAKLSFTLALLGQDTICLDTRLLNVMFPRPEHRLRFEKLISKREGRLSERAVAAYEAAEDAFLEGNPHYRPRDPLGRARAQWMSWEAVGQKGATHRVWLDLLPAA